jgi:hypothetical protein
VKQKIELQEVRSKSIKLDSGEWQDVFTVKILVNNQPQIIETDLKLNLIKELENKYSPLLYDYSCLYSKYSKTPKERRF